MYLFLSPNLTVEKTAENELLKYNHLRTLTIVYETSTRHEVFDLPCDTSLVTLLMDLQLRKALDMVHKKQVVSVCSTDVLCLLINQTSIIYKIVICRSWGDTMAGFIKAKWECISKIGRYAEQVRLLIALFF